MTDLRDLLGPALGRIPSGLFIVTASSGQEETAFLGSWVMQAGFEPPLVTVAVGHDRPALAMLQQPDSVFAISILGADERDKMGPFVRSLGPEADALAGLPVARTPSGQPLVQDCLAWLECRTQATLAAGDHTLILAQVVDGALDRKADSAVHMRPDGFRY